MKKCKLFPGDMIEWVYMFNNLPVDKGDILWSSLMSQYVPINEPSLLISITEDVYFWFNSKGLFHARVDDIGDGISQRII